MKNLGGRARGSAKGKGPLSEAWCHQSPIKNSVAVAQADPVPGDNLEHNDFIVLTVSSFR
jgi:hypothetical protein